MIKNSDGEKAKVSEKEREDEKNTMSKQIIN